MVDLTDKDTTHIEDWQNIIISWFRYQITYRRVITFLVYWPFSRKNKTKQNKTKTKNKNKNKTKQNKTKQNNTKTKTKTPKKQ